MFNNVIKSLSPTCFGPYWPIIREYTNCIKRQLGILIVPRTSPKFQQAAPTYHALFCLLYLYYTEEASTVLLHARDQYTKQLFYTIIVLPDDGLIRAKTCRSL